MTTRTIVGRDNLPKGTILGREILNARITGWIRDHGSRQADEILDPQPVGKRLDLEKIWTGGMGSAIDEYLEQMKPITGGLTPGHTLGPSPLTGLMELGRVWGGQLEQQIRTARANSGAKELQPLEAALGYVSTSKTGGQMADAVRNVRRARDGILGSLVAGVGHIAHAAGGLLHGLGNAAAAAPHILKSSGGESNGGESEDGGLPEALASLNQKSNDRARQMNRDNATFWEQRNQAHRAQVSKDRAASPDVMTAIQRQVNFATTVPNQIAAMNMAAKAFWKGR
jgi:hypothetical protein